MDKSIVVAEESHNKRNESLALASKRSASLVQIDSIAIDINCPAEVIESPQNEHFSIRDFVSEMRKKDKKNCYPFTSEEGKHDDGGMELPPLSVPRFRWWQCPNCVPEFVDQKSRLGMILSDKSDITGAGCCQNRNTGEKEGLLKHSIRNIGDGETNYLGDKIITYKQQCMDGYRTAANVRTTEVGTSRTNVAEANPVQITETREEFSDKVYSAGINPLNKPDKSKKASSGSDDAIAYSALPHKRKRKLRSLADIINEEQNFSIGHTRTKSLSSAQTEDDSNSLPQIEVSSDAAKRTKTGLRKRKKIVLEDDGGPIETSRLNFAAKKLKSSTLEAEAEKISKASQRVEISESDSERDEPSWPAVRITKKALPRKVRRPKALDINRRQINVENRTAVQTMSHFYVHYANLGTSFGNTRNVCPLFKKSLSGQETDDLSDLPKGKRPEGGDYNAYVSLSDSSLGDCVDREKVALNLSLSSYMGTEMNSKNQESSGKYTGIPDLNESFVDSTSVMEGQQVPDFPKMTSFARHENLDMSGPCSKESAREGKRPSGGFEQHQATNNRYINKTVVECGPSSDDIPMEIVELLAKNQHDRALDNSRKHFVANGIDDSFKRPHYAENTRGPVNFPYRTGVSVTSCNMGLGQGFLNFPQTKNCCPDKTQFRHLSPLMAGHQRIPLYPVPNHMPGPRLREDVDLLWAPRRKNVTFGLTGTQSCPVQSNSLNVQSYRGKTVSNIQGKKVDNHESLLKGGKIGPGRMPMRSMDAYSNEAIPAMQLLSLMDQGIVSGSSFNVGPNNFLDRPFSPCNHHPRLNKSDDQSEKLVGSSLFGKSNRVNDFPGLLNGARLSGESSKKSFSQVQMPPHEGNSRAVDLAGPVNLVGQPSRSDLRLDVCTLNRNPADFSILDAKNKFMISAKDLKPKKWNSSRDRARPANVEGPKRQKPRKDSSIKKARENKS